jgi:hypothetical protein
MRQVRFVLPIALVFIMLPTIVRADIQYNVNLSIGTGTVTGTITTDGNTGTLGLSDFTDWNLTIKDGVVTANLTGPSSGNNSTVSLNGSAVSATASNILFDFSSPASSNAYFFFENVVGPVNFVCFGGGGAGGYSANCANGQAGNVEAFELNGGDNQSVLLTGNLPIATAAPAATPEPSSLLLFGSGVLGLIGAVRRKMRV